MHLNPVYLYCIGIIDFRAEIRYDTDMESLKTAIERTLTAFVAQYTGVRPVLKPSKRAHLATGSFLRTDAAGAAAHLAAHLPECMLFGVPLLQSVTEQNGWLLFFVSPDVLDAYAESLPDAAEPDDGYVVRRLWMYARHDDAKVPDDVAVLQGFFAALFGLSDGERLFLAAPRQKDGMERVRLEQRMTRLAKILLYERRNTP